MSSNWVASTCGLVLLASCGKSVPPEIKPALDGVRDDARKIAEVAAKTCGDQFASGQFYVTAGGGGGVKLLPGQTVVPTIPSPAKGTSLETNPDVVDVMTTCMAPAGAGPGGSVESFGSDLGTLRHAFGPGDFQNGNWSTSENSCRSSPSSCEKVEVPSRYLKDKRSADLTLVRPMVGGPPGGTVTVTIVLGKK